MQSNDRQHTHERIPEVLEAYELLLNDTMALDYCGITGRERALILNDPVFSRETRRIKASKYIEEIEDINELVNSLKRTNASDDNARVGAPDEDQSKIINLKMKVATMRREMLSLSSNEKENDEVESLNIFFIDVTREEFERLSNVEIHDGDADAMLTSDSDKDAPIMTAEKRRKDNKVKTSVPHELARNTIEYVDEHGDKVIQEVM